MNGPCGEKAVEAYLGSLQKFGIKLGLAQTEELLKRAGNPEKGLRFLHLAGTNGKGSVGAMLEKALRSAGYRTGFYSSPHLLSVRERIRIDGKAVSAEVFSRLAGRLIPEAETMRRNGACPTYFEFLTVLAAMAFAEAGCEFAVWETGMGGRLDATSAVPPMVCAVTNVALDHQQYLGRTVAKIAGEKAGIIRPGIPVVTGKMPPSARKTIAAHAAEWNARWIAAEYPARGVRSGVDADGVWRQHFTLDGVRFALPLAGAMQRRNAAVVLAVLREIRKTAGLDLEKAVAGLRNVGWPARAQLLPGNRVLIDGGHNPDGLAALIATLKERWPGKRFDWVFGAFADKDARGGLKALAPLAKSFNAVGFAEGSRLSVAPETLAQWAREAGIGKVSAVPLEEILQASRRRTAAEPLIVAGSLYLAGEALALLAAPETVLDLP